MENLELQNESVERAEENSGMSAPFNNLTPEQCEKDNSAPYDLVRLYLLELAQYKLLSKEEEIELAMRIHKKNDEEAANRLIRANLRLVVKIAMDFRRHWIRNPLDLIQEGNLGLLQAVKKFDPSRGVKFSYYASFWVKAYMLRFIMDNSKLVKIGTTQGQRRLFFNLEKERERLIGKGLRPEPSLVAERLNVKEEVVVEMSQRLKGSELSLDAPMGYDSREFSGALLRHPGMAIDEQLSQHWHRETFLKKLQEFREGLSPRETDIFDNRIMSEKPMILQELGEKYRISRERVRQIQKGIIKKIKEWSKKEIPDFEEDYGEFLN